MFHEVSVSYSCYKQQQLYSIFKQRFLWTLPPVIFCLLSSYVVFGTNGGLLNTSIKTSLKAVCSFFASYFIFLLLEWYKYNDGTKKRDNVNLEYSVVTFGKFSSYS
jgi:hypothetical protein